jgi:acetolactate synthase-1/2/3 large subunit
VPEVLLGQEAGEVHTAAGSRRSAPWPAPEALDSVLARLRPARRPAMLLGGGVLAANATEDAVALAEHEDLPVFAGWRRPDVFPNDHELYLGQTGYAAPPSVRERLLSADFLLVVGCRLGEVASFGYRVPAGGTQVAQVDAEPAILARSLAQLTVQADAGVFLRELLARARTLGTAPRRAANRADRARWVAETNPVVSPDGVLRGTDVMARLRTLMPGDAIVTVDAGNFSGWVARYLRSNRPFSFLGPTSGAMGYAVPAAIGARLRNPHRPVVAFAGDGGFAMTGIELATAVAQDAPVTTVVFDNGEYGTIRMHQEARHPGRQVATRLGHIDFVRFTRSLGGEGAEVDSADEFADAFKAALASATPFTIVVRTGAGGRSVDDDR